MQAIFKNGLLYTALSFSGLITDFAISNILYYALDLHLTLAGFLGFLSGAIAVYFVNLQTTFKSRGFKAHWRTLFRWVRTSFWAAMLRIILLWIFSFFEILPAMMAFVMATALSSGFRTILGYLYVFRSPPPRRDPSESSPSDTTTP